MTTGTRPSSRQSPARSLHLFPSCNIPLPLRSPHSLRRPGRSRLSSFPPPPELSTVVRYSISARSSPPASLLPRRTALKISPDPSTCPSLQQQWPSQSPSSLSTSASLLRVAWATTSTPQAGAPRPPRSNSRVREPAARRYAPMCA